MATNLVDYCKGRYLFCVELSDKWLDPTGHTIYWHCKLKKQKNKIVLFIVFLWLFVAFGKII